MLSGTKAYLDLTADEIDEVYDFVGDPRPTIDAMPKRDPLSTFPLRMDIPAVGEMVLRKDLIEEIHPNGEKFAIFNVERVRGTTGAIASLFGLKETIRINLNDILIDFDNRRILLRGKTDAGTPSKEAK